VEDSSIVREVKTFRLSHGIAAAACLVLVLGLACIAVAWESNLLKRQPLLDCSATRSESESVNSDEWLLTKASVGSNSADSLLARTSNSQSNNADLIQLLRHQDKDPIVYLGKGLDSFYPTTSARIQTKGHRYVIWKLERVVTSIPGDCAVRFLLVNADGRVVDTATIHWRSRLLRRFDASIADPSETDGSVIRISYNEALNGRECFLPPVVVLHDHVAEGKTSLKLDWTGTSHLGSLEVFEDHFAHR